MSNQGSSQDGFKDGDAKNLRDGQAGRDKQAKGEEKSGKKPNERKRIPPHADRCDPELKDERYGKNAGQPKSPRWATVPGFRKSEEQFSSEELRRFGSMAIRPLGRRFLDLAIAFETFLTVGVEYNAGRGSLAEVSRVIEERQLNGTYPNELPVSGASLHRAVGLVEKFFQSHFELKVMPRLVARSGEGLPVTRLTPAGNVAWALIRTHLVAMGYDDIWDSPSSA